MRVREENEKKFFFVFCAVLCSGRGSSSLRLLVIREETFVKEKIEIVEISIF